MFKNWEYLIHPLEKVHLVWIVLVENMNTDYGSYEVQFPYQFTKVSSDTQTQISIFKDNITKCLNCFY